MIEQCSKANMSWQKCIRDFLKIRTSYDVLPLSYRLIILNTELLVKKSLNILLQNGTSHVPSALHGCSARIP